MRSNHQKSSSHHCAFFDLVVFSIAVIVCAVIANISPTTALVRNTLLRQTRHGVLRQIQRIDVVKAHVRHFIAAERGKLFLFSAFANQRVSFSYCSRMNAIDESELESAENVDVTATQEENSLDEGCSSSVQPLYITIGPPCSGKTTWIKRQSSKLGSDIVDVCIDDQPGVYYALPTSWFLSNCSSSDDASKGQTLSPNLPTKETTIFGKTVRERIAEQAELRFVLRRLAKIISAEEFQTALGSCTLPLHIRPLVEVVEDIMHNAETNNQSIALPMAIDLFVLEAIFRPSTANSLDGDEEDSYSALERIDLLLNDQSKVPLSSPVALGNTNTRAREYSKALALAEKTNRPVHFAVFYDEEMRIPRIPCRSDSAIGQGDNTGIFDMFVEGSYYGLIRRNIDRLLGTGRYIPTNVIWDMRERTIELVNDAFEVCQQQNDFASGSTSMIKLRFHQSLAQLAGFEMNDDRLVSHRSSKRKVSMLDDPESNRRASDFIRHRRPWDQPASAVRGYRGRFPSNLHSNAVPGQGGQHPAS